MGTGELVVLLEAADGTLYRLFVNYHLFEAVLALALVGTLHLVKTWFRFLTETFRCGFRFVGDVADEYFNLRDRILARRRRLSDIQPTGSETPHSY
jgi:hypothetical protein